MDRIGYLKKKWIWFYTKIIRENATPEFIARGWAIGMFFGFMIPFGFQLICSIPTAFLLRGSRIGATLGTLATNHFTIWFIYPFQCWVGNLFLGNRLTYDKISEELRFLVENQDYATLMKLGSDLILSFFIGGALFAAVSTPVTYLAVRNIVRNYLERKKMRRDRTAGK